MSADCAEVEKRCRQRVADDWVKSGCVDRVEAVYRPCVAKCDSPFGACADGCAEKVKPCDSSGCQARWRAASRGREMSCRGPGLSIA